MNGVFPLFVGYAGFFGANQDRERLIDRMRQRQGI